MLSVEVEAAVEPSVKQSGPRLMLHAEYGGWELARVKLHPDGTRKVVLRRRRSAHRLPGPLL